MTPKEAALKLRSISDEFLDLANALRISDNGRMLSGAWTATLGAVSDACEGLALLLEVFGNQELDAASPVDPNPGGTHG